MLGDGRSGKWVFQLDLNIQDISPRFEKRLGRPQRTEHTPDVKLAIPSLKQADDRKCRRYANIGLDLDTVTHPDTELFREPHPDHNLIRVDVQPAARNHVFLNGADAFDFRRLAASNIDSIALCAADHKPRATNAASHGLDPRKGCDFLLDFLPLLELGALLDLFLRIGCQEAVSAAISDFVKCVRCRIRRLDGDVRKWTDQVTDEALLDAGDQGLDEDDDGDSNGHGTDGQKRLTSTAHQVSPCQLEFKA